MYTYRNTGAFVTTDAQSDLLSVADALGEVAAYYPGFDAWYWRKVVPGAADGSRLVDTVVRDGVTVAVAISKKAKDEMKLCALFVRQEARGQGHGIRLLDRACLWLGTDKPLATIPEERMPAFAKIVRERDWVMTGTLLSAYRPGRIEYVYNGAVPDEDRP